jgi:hypothetical protein
VPKPPEAAPQAPLARPPRAHALAPPGLQGDRIRKGRTRHSDSTLAGIRAAVNAPAHPRAAHPRRSAQPPSTDPIPRRSIPRLGPRLTQPIARPMKRDPLRSPGRPLLCPLLEADDEDRTRDLRLGKHPFAGLLPQLRAFEFASVQLDAGQNCSVRDMLGTRLAVAAWSGVAVKRCPCLAICDGVSGKRSMRCASAESKSHARLPVRHANPQLLRNVRGPISHDRVVVIP